LTRNNLNFDERHSKNSSCKRKVIQTLEPYIKSCHKSCFSFETFLLKLSSPRRRVCPTGMWALWVCSYWPDQIKYQILHRERRDAHFYFEPFSEYFNSSGAHLKNWYIYVLRSSGKLFPFARLSFSTGRRSVNIRLHKQCQVFYCSYPAAVQGKWQVFPKKYECSRFHAIRLFVSALLRWSAIKLARLERKLRDMSKKHANWFNLHDESVIKLAVLGVLRQAPCNSKVCNLLDFGEFVLHT
jgi:hypothetical protein